MCPASAGGKETSGEASVARGGDNTVRWCSSAYPGLPFHPVLTPHQMGGSFRDDIASPASQLVRGSRSGTAASIASGRTNSGVLSSLPFVTVVDDFDDGATTLSHTSNHGGAAGSIASGQTSVLAASPSTRVLGVPAMNLVPPAALLRHAGRPSGRGANMALQRLAATLRRVPPRRWLTGLALEMGFTTHDTKVRRDVALAVAVAVAMAVLCLTLGWRCSDLPPQATHPHHP